jgi:uncharacterized protein YqfA (UPF0365 family)
MNIILGILLLMGVVSFFFLLSMFPIGIYIQCMSAGVSASPMDLIGMGLRNVPTDLVISTFIKGIKGGLDLSLDRLEAHFLSGGNIVRVIDALISAGRANIDLTFEKAAAIDLAGRDVLEAVRMRVEPRVISTGNIAGVAKNGIEVSAKVKITVRANLDTMVGGAGEETILARVGEGIVSAIGSSNGHSDILKAPELITKTIMAAGLDARTAFEIVSVDILDVDIGRNIGAILQNDQAEADKKVAVAKAEGRRAMAIAQMQENKAMEQEMRALVIESEIKIPQALAGCFREGKLIPPRKPRKNRLSPATPTPTPVPTPSIGFGADNG